MIGTKHERCGNKTCAGVKFSWGVYAIATIAGHTHLSLNGVTIFTSAHHSEAVSVSQYCDALDDQNSDAQHAKAFSTLHPPLTGSALSCVVQNKLRHVSCCVRLSRGYISDKCDVPYVI